jgi:tetratricopeptide (TPR) repeat protein
VKLFISYSRDDAGNFAKHIHKFMKNKGHDVFIDVNSIAIGDPWARSIEKNISECDVFIIILTPDSLTSHHVEREVLQAQKQNKIIVPCIHQYVDYSEIKWRLQENQGIEFSDRYELALNLYPKIKNLTNKQSEKPSSLHQRQTIQDVSISEDVDDLNQKGNDLSNQGKYQEAIEYYERALRIDPNHVNALNNKGVALANQGEYKEAIECYDKALEIDPNYTTAQNNKKLALEKLKNSKKRDSEDVDALIEKGFDLYIGGEYEEAIECYDKALSVNPYYVVALHNKGKVFSYLEKYEEAIECYDKALEIDPNYVDPLYNKGLALANQGEYEEAIECYDKYLEVDPNNVAVLNNKGFALANQGEYKEAIECYDKALEVYPNNLTTLYNKGFALANQGEYKEAIECYDKALEIDPNYTTAQNNKKLALERLKTSKKKGFFGFDR